MRAYRIRPQQEKTIMDIIDDGVKILGAVSIFLLLVSYIDLVSYYMRFNIQISTYIGISEIILSAIGSLFSLFSWILIGSITWTGLLSAVIKNRNTDNSARKSWFITVIALLSFLLIFVLWDFFFNNNTKAGVANDKYFNLYTLLFSATGLLLIILHPYVYPPLLKKFKSLANTLFGLLVFFPVFIMIIFLKNYWLSKEIQRDTNKKNITLTLSGGELVSPNDSIYYIGKTSEYYFFYNNKSKSGIVYPSSDVKKAEMK